MADVTSALGIAPELWDVLACPCPAHAPVRPDEATGRIICTECGRSFEVRDGIPVMLLDEAMLPDGQGDLLGGS